MLTLTVNPDYVEAVRMTVEQIIGYLTCCWNKFYPTLCDHAGEKVRIIRALERHPYDPSKPDVRRYPHYHVLLNRYFTDDWLSAEWSASGGGTSVKIRTKPPEEGVSYIVKHMGGPYNDGLGGLPKGVQRYWTQPRFKPRIRRPYFGPYVVKHGGPIELELERVLDHRRTILSMRKDSFGRVIQFNWSPQ